MSNFTSVYLDYAATRPTHPEVMKRMSEVLELLGSGSLGNPAALHAPGQRAKHLLEESRQAVAELINADPEEIIFTSGGSEANNTVMNIFQDKCIAASAIEHASVLEPARDLAAWHIELPVDEHGFVSVENPVVLSPSPDLVSVMLANNELGTIEPIKEFREQFKDSAFHTDATQAVGKIPVDVKALGVDYLTFSAHKLGGPIGIGALYVRKGAKFTSFIMGGHQESGRRAGTSNVLLATGFAEACRIAKREQSRYQAVASLRDGLRERILKEVPYSSENSPRNNVLPNILNMSFQAAEGESIQLYLDAAGIVVSTGSACAAADIAPSHVLMATRHDAEIAHSSIRFSLGPDTSAHDIEQVMAVLPGIIQKLQSISTVKIKEPV